jgi:hypothetical protein
VRLFSLVSLLFAGLAPSVKYVPAKVEVTQVRFGGAQDERLKLLVIAHVLAKPKTLNSKFESR